MEERVQLCVVQRFVSDGENLSSWITLMPVIEFPASANDPSTCNAEGSALESSTVNREAAATAAANCDEFIGVGKSAFVLGIFPCERLFCVDVCSLCMRG